MSKKDDLVDILTKPLLWNTHNGLLTYLGLSRTQAGSASVGESISSCDAIPLCLLGYNTVMSHALYIYSPSLLDSWLIITSSFNL